MPVVNLSVTLFDGTITRADAAVWLADEDKYYPIGHRDVVWQHDKNVFAHKYNSIFFGDKWYSEEGFWNEHFRCRECEHTFHNSAAHSNDSAWCRTCWNATYNKPIKDYSEDVLRYLRFGPLVTGERHTFGVELEVEGAKHYAQELLEQFLEKDAILKRDGSLDDGFEIVTRPAGLTHTKSIFSKEMTNWLKNKGGKSYNTNTCGLHIHVGRKQLTQLQIGKILCFMHSPKNKEFVEKIASRTTERWASLKDKKKLCMKDVSHNGSSGRYTAVNLENDATIEFRIFKGTLNHNSIHRSLEFVQALLDFTSPASTAIADATSLDEFIYHVVKGGKKAYPNLLGWLKDKNYVVVKKPKKEGIVVPMFSSEAIDFAEAA